MSWITRELGWIKSKAIYEWLPGKAKRKLKFYGGFIGQGDLCFDIGSHLGDRTDTWLRLGGEVVVVEPQPRFAEYLKKKFNNRKEVHLERVAIGAVSGELPLYICNDHPTITTMSESSWQQQMDDVATYKVEYDEVINVEVKTVDQLIFQYGHPKFVKIDVEGFELQVLQGLSSSPDYISIEFLSFDMDRTKACVERLAEMGYAEFNWSFRETFEWAIDKWSTSDEMLDSILNHDGGVFSGDIYGRISNANLNHN